MAFSFTRCLHSFVFVLTIVVLSLKTSASSATVLKTPDYTIRYTGQIQGAADFAKNRPFFNKLFDLVVGKVNDQLVKPMSVLHVSDEQFIILDQGTRSLVTVNLTMQKYGSIVQQQCQSLIGLTSLPDGTVLFTDSQRNMVFLQPSSGKEAAIFNKNDSLQQPTGIVYSAFTQYVYVAETAAHRLSVFDPNGCFVKSIGRHGTGLGEFNFPTFLAVDGIGNIYVVDSMNFRVQRLNPQGVAVSCFGKSGDASGDLARPKGIACDTFGHIFVVDGLFHNIQIFDANGNYLEHFGHQGHSPGEFWMPTGIYIDRQNKIYVADTYNNRIQIFQLKAIQ
ncbi:6-bladed beta-propeller [candidate division KSB1 bacterium]|nr:6-bladed beta-propeller [candidate division KSB1 bacterium]